MRRDGFSDGIGGDGKRFSPGAMGPASRGPVTTAPFGGGRVVWAGWAGDVVGEAISGRTTGARSGCNGEKIPVAIGGLVCCTTTWELLRGLLGREDGDRVGR